MSSNNLSEKIKDYIVDLQNDDDIKFNDILRLVSYVISSEKKYIHLQDLNVDDDTWDKIKDLLDKYYIQKIPLQYITGKQYFYNEEYFVDENVLIPRSDSEILVEKAIEYAYKYNLKSMLDLCSGTGCIGISVLNNSNIKKCTFVDISKKALDITNRNIIHNKVSKQVLTIKSDLFENVKERYDLIVSNPPYIKSDIIDTLSEYVKKEPIIALDGGKDGLNYYRKILSKANEHLNENGYLMFEIGYDELEDIKELVKNTSNAEIIECVKDLENNDRVVICHFLQK